MHNPGRRETIEERAAGRRVGSDVPGVNEIPELHVGQLLRETDRVESVTRWAEHGTELSRTFLEALQRVLAVVENDAAKSMVDTVVDVIREFTFANDLPDDLRD